VVEHDLRFEALGVFQKALHQFRALHAVHVGGPVVDLGGGHQLATLGHAGDQQRVEVGTGGIDGGGVAGRAGTQNQDFGVLGRGAHGDFLEGAQPQMVAAKAHIVRSRFCPA